jgi:quercetin dioxygenase-like cupin family protein
MHSSSAYGFVAGTWPFGIVEAVWTAVARSGARSGRQLDRERKRHDRLPALTALDRGHRLPDHRTAGRISIQTVAGHVTVHVGTDTIDLPTGRLLVLDRDISHDEEALETRAFLLTIAWPDGAA